MPILTVKKRYEWYIFPFNVRELEVIYNCPLRQW